MGEILSLLMEERAGKEAGRHRCSVFGGPGTEDAPGVAFLWLLQPRLLWAGAGPSLGQVGEDGGAQELPQVLLGKVCLDSKVTWLPFTLSGHWICGHCKELLWPQKTSAAPSRVTASPRAVKPALRGLQAFRRSNVGRER